jgi:predicted flap endonuclease-1-like 5' DNA nuclease
MFQQNVALGPGTEAFSSHLVEIIIMLLGAAIIGYIIGRLFKKSYKEEYFELDETHSKCAGIENGLKENISGLTLKNSDLENNIVSLKQTIDDLTKEKDKLTNEKEDLLKQLATLNSEKGKALAEISQMQDHLANINAEMEKVQAEKNQLQNQLAALNAELAKMKAAPAGQVSNVPKLDLAAALKMMGTPVRFDDLKIVEGIGPGIEDLFHRAGIRTWSQLANTAAVKLKAILDSGGTKFQMHDPSTWPQQASLALKGAWQELKVLQDKLKGGKE